MVTQHEMVVPTRVRRAAKKFPETQLHSGRGAAKPVSN
jgi:hypothetical protein